MAGIARTVRDAGRTKHSRVTISNDLAELRTRWPSTLSKHSLRPHGSTPAWRRSAEFKTLSGAHTTAMTQSLGLVSLVVREYDAAIAFFVGTLGFSLIEDTFIPEQDKRWVVVAPAGSRGSRLLLARASTAEQEARIGNQTGGRVFLFLYTDNFDRDHQMYRARGVRFIGEPRQEAYGKVAVFEDLYGNRWDLLEPTSGLAR